MTAAEAKMLSHLIDTTTQLPGWRVLRQAADQNRTVHLAVLVEPYLTYILDSRKTIESRLSKHAIAPFRQVGTGDLVLLKLSGGPVVGCFTAGNVEFVNLGPAELARLRVAHSEAICVGGDFWGARADKRYATLVGVRDVRKLRPARVAKADQRGWVVLRDGRREPAGMGEQLALGAS